MKIIIKNNRYDTLIIIKLQTILTAEVNAT